jgi:transcriptional regulator with XRE-family HTH domain
MAHTQTVKYTQFASDLKQLMERYDLSVDAIAALFGTTATTIYRWKNGSNEPEHLGMANLALKALNMSYGITQNRRMIQIMEDTKKLNKDAEEREKLKKKNRISDSDERF